MAHHETDTFFGCMTVFLASLMFGLGALSMWLFLKIF